MKISSILFIGCLIFPPVLSVSLGGLVITPLRFLGIVFFMMYVPKLFSSNRLTSKVALLDGLIVFHCLWVFVALSVVHDVRQGVESGGIYLIELLSFYAFGRALARNPLALIKFLEYLFVVISVSAVLAWIEALTGVNVVYKLLGMTYYRLADPRMGLERASVYMPHPILYGLFASMIMGLAVYSLRKSRAKTSLVFAMATIPALSSAPLLSLLVQLSAYLYDRTMKAFNARWKILVVGVASALLLVSLVSEGGVISVIINNLTFNPQTGYYRISIWDYGTAEVARNPIFGIGFNDWIRAKWMYSSSVDNFWLLTAMRYGLPSIISLLLLLVLILRRMLTTDYGYLSSVRTGWVISFAGIFLVGSTVHFWANAFSGFGLFVGIGATIASYSKFTIFSFDSLVGANEKTE